ncbi:bark storage protein A-like isoform X2 [Diospyros lotus]|uniref:bark storage protein A-like isoform X2 n=1 Tax=Diospyros lotus TaxID=55363 RepID=UPI002253F559|nr:bark storage protein A-like isoform X2 [Diospyros lotus]
MAVKKKRLLTAIALLVVASNVEQSVQLKSNHPLHSAVDRINQNGGPYIGMLMAYSTEESALLDSGLFFPSSDLPSVDFSGRRFNIGKIRDVDVIYVMTGQQTLNAGITVQMLVGAFDVKGIVFYGTAGSANDSLNIGDVSVPKYVAYTASWKWKEFRSEKGGLAELEFGAYNFPTKGDNLFAKVEFTPQEVYSNGQPMEELFWLEVEPKWFVLASQLQNMELLQCVNETHCLPEMPKVVYGLRASTADIFLDNAAYRKFLFDEFNVSTVDEESSAIVMASLTNGVPCIVFRGVSDLAGAGPEKFRSSSLSSLASANAFSVAVEFLGLIGPADQTQDHWNLKLQQQ